jgi:hypothetical protein
VYKRQPSNLGTLGLNPKDVFWLGVVPVTLIGLVVLGSREDKKQRNKNKKNIES